MASLIYRALLRCYPRGFRERYAADMERLVAEMLAAERGWRRPALWFGVVRDTAVQAVVERRADATGRRGRGGTGRPRRSPGERMHSIIQDLRLAARGFVRQPGFTLAAVLTIALGIGANTTIFSIVSGVLLRPLPYPDPDRLVMLWEIFPAAQMDTVPLSDADVLDYREARAFTGVAVARSAEAALTGDGEPVRPRAMAVSPSLFPMLGAEAAMGRVFLQDEEQPDRARVVLLSDGFWRSRFGGDSDIVGRTVSINDRPYEIVGVMPASFQFPPPVTFGGRMIAQEPADLWVPFAIDRSALDRGSHSHFVLARLKPDVTVAQADAEVGAIVARINEREPDEHAGITGAHVLPMHQQSVQTIRPMLLVLMAAVGFVLLVACVNVANLLLARAMSRRREVAIRTAVGASRGRLLQQFLTESLLLAFVAGWIGVMGGAWALSVVADLQPIELPPMFVARLDGGVLAFSVGLTVLTALLFGLLPAMQSSRADLQTALKEGRTVTGSSHARMRSLLVVAEMALAVVLLVGAGLTTRSLTTLLAVDKGFDPEGVLTVGIELPDERYAEPAEWPVLYDRVLERVRALPGVESAAGVQYLPLTPDIDGGNYQVEGEPPPEGALLIGDRMRVTPGYFETVRMGMVAGRAFTPADGPNSQPVAIVNETFAQRHWPNADPLGHRVAFGDAPAENDWRTVVGVVSDIAREGLDAGDRPTVYMPMAQVPNPGIWFIARTTGDPMRLAAGVKNVIWEIDPKLPVDSVHPMTDRVRDAVRVPRFTAIVLSLFGLTGLLLAAIGIYGVMSFDVVQRSREIGIRLALGARPDSVAAMVLGRGLGLTAIGAVAGIVAAVAASRVLASLLFGVSATDPLTFALVVFVLMAVAAVATWLPARRATRVDPVEVLRAE